MIKALKLSTFKTLYSLGIFDIKDFDIQSLIGWHITDFQNKDIYSINRKCGDILKELYSLKLQGLKIRLYEEVGRFIIDFTDEDLRIVFSVVLYNNTYSFIGKHFQEVFNTRFELIKFLNSY